MSGAFHSRRPRRTDDGRYLPKDAAAWRRLIQRARAAARNPKAHADALGAAAERCMKHVPPPGHAVRDSVFLRLALLGRRVWQARGDERDAAAEGLADLAGQCAAALEAADSREPRTVAERKDIYG